MSLYLEFKVKTDATDVITGISYHCQLGLLAILSYNQNDESQILICDELVSIIFKFFNDYYSYTSSLGRAFAQFRAKCL